MKKSISSFLLMTSFSAVFAGCNLSSPARHELTDADHFDVINGTKSPSGSAIANSTVYIITERGRCTGILLNDHVVITAAHCNAGLGSKVQLSERRDDCSKTEVAEAAFAPTDAESNLPNDLLMLKLKNPVCKPAPVVFAPAPIEGDALKLAGLGLGTDPGAPDLLDLTVYSSKETLQALFLNDYPHDAEVQKDWDFFAGLYPDLKAINNLFAVPKNPGQSSCLGDSGGPYFNEKDGVIQLYGIHSGIFPHAKKGAEGCDVLNYVQFFTPIEPNLEWITQQLNKWQ